MITIRRLRKKRNNSVAVSSDRIDWFWSNFLFASSMPRRYHCWSRKPAMNMSKVVSRSPSGTIFERGHIFIKRRIEKASDTKRNRAEAQTVRGSLSLSLWYLYHSPRKDETWHKTRHRFFFSVRRRSDRRLSCFTSVQIVPQVAAISDRADKMRMVAKLSTWSGRQ